MRGEAAAAPVTKARGTILPASGYRADAFIEEEIMTFGKGALLWLLGIPLPIILLLVLFWR
jgi:hypothetical protein